MVFCIISLYKATMTDPGTMEKQYVKKKKNDFYLVLNLDIAKFNLFAKFFRRKSQGM
jgi:hypothetical protein